MKARTKFLKMYYKLPEKARNELCMDFAFSPRTLRVCALEVQHNTELGKKILETLGYEDE